MKRMMNLVWSLTSFSFKSVVSKRRLLEWRGSDACKLQIWLICSATQWHNQTANLSLNCHLSKMTKQRGHKVKVKNFPSKKKEKTKGRKKTETRLGKLFSLLTHFYELMDRSRSKNEILRWLTF